MCLILFAYKAHPEYPLIVAANRDEYYARPTAAADFWDDDSGILGGRDLEKGGTWLGITRRGRFAAVTNYREPHLHKENTNSRGLLVSDYLRGQESATTYVERISRKADHYSGFNLVVGDWQHLTYCSNRTREAPLLEPGIYGISNGLLDTPWPKVARGKETLQAAINQSTVKPEALLNLLVDDTQATDDALPETGVGLVMERLFSPIFITSPAYGTRSSTVVLVNQAQRVTFIERRVVVKEGGYDTRRYDFKISR